MATAQTTVRAAIKVTADDLQEHTLTLMRRFYSETEIVLLAKVREG